MQIKRKAEKKTDYLQSVINESFWSGKLSVKQWRAAIKDPSMNHKAILVTSFTHMPSSVLLGEIGEKSFIKKWPEIRRFFPPENKRVILFDGIWGILTTGDSQYPVSLKISNLSKGRRELLAEVVNDPGISIYSLQKHVKRPYTRVYKDIKLLVEQGLVFIENNYQKWPKYFTSFFF